MWFLSLAFLSAQVIPHLRVDGRDCIFSSVCQHSTLCVGVFHLHHETPWNSCALFNSGNRLKILVLLRKEMPTDLKTHTFREISMIILSCESL